MLREPVTLTVGGRTDRGVHAWGQVASYDGRPPPAPAEALRSINALVGDDVAVLGWSVAADGFDARRDARSRTYCYRVLHRREPSAFLRGRALWWPRALDREALVACAAALPGTHDFTAFTPTETDHVRFERDVLCARWDVRGDVLEFWIEADSFMRHMNRVLVGTMLEVAAGRRTLDRFARCSTASRAPRPGRPRRRTACLAACATAARAHARCPRPAESATDLTACGLSRAKGAATDGQHVHGVP